MICTVDSMLDTLKLVNCIKISSFLHAIKFYIYFLLFLFGFSSFSQGTDSSVTAANTAATATTAAAPTDPTAYYNDFWQYATYYGEAAARVYYGAWSPPEGTSPPEGVVLPAVQPTSTATVGNNIEQHGAAPINGGGASDASQSGQTNEDKEVNYFHAYKLNLCLLTCGFPSQGLGKVSERGKQHIHK